MAVDPSLIFPDLPPPGPGAVVEVAQDLLWARLPMPYRLDHVNVYLLRDIGGWAVIDTGICTTASKTAWRALLSGPLAGQRISRVIATHAHPDHLGLAGWLCHRFDAPLLTSETCWLTGRLAAIGRDEPGLRHRYEFYLHHGMEAAMAAAVAIHGNAYWDDVAPLPPQFHRLLMGDQIDIGARRLIVLTGDGHAAEQVMLYCAADRLLFCADQVMERISPNISVEAQEPNSDPLGHYLRSLRWMAETIPPDVLALPGHHRPFFGFPGRCREIAAHHEARCEALRAACATTPANVYELVSVIYPRALDPHQMGFAFAETLAHVNRLIRRGELKWLLSNSNAPAILSTGSSYK